MLVKSQKQKKPFCLKPIVLAVHPEDFAINPNLKDGLTFPELTLHIQKLIYKWNKSVRCFIAEKLTRYMTPFAITILIVLVFLGALHKPRGSVGWCITLGNILACLYIVFFLSAKTVLETLLTKIFISRFVTQPKYHCTLEIIRNHIHRYNDQ